MIREETKQTDPVGQTTTRRPPVTAYWLIARAENHRMEVFTLERGGKRTLPVFSFEEEAEMFLRFGSVDNDWRVRESSAGEVVSVLYGPCARVRAVALDPLPEMMAEKTMELISLNRRRFIERVIAREGGPSIPADRTIFHRPFYRPAMRLD